MKKAIIIIGALMAVLVSLFIIQKEYDVEVEIVINKPKQQVFDYVKYLKNQENYSKWAMMDPTMTKTFTGTDGTVGFISGWDSDNSDVGKGEQEIVKITEGERIDYELRFFEPFSATEPAYMITESVSAEMTKVKWGFKGHLPMLMTFFMDVESMINDDLTTGLSNLKKVLEV